MIHTIVPALWLLVVVVGLPQLSETIYTPALPDIAMSLAVSDASVEFTLTMFLIGFAVGTLIWGKLSDRYGRRPCLLMGIAFYIAGCAVCWSSRNITVLLLGRFIQAFGGSTGSVLGQAICRDVFHGPQRGKVYSVIGGALAFSPAVGPIIGGIIDQLCGWRFIFIVLACAGLLVLLATYLRLPETRDTSMRSGTLMSTVVRQLTRDSRVIGFAILVGASNGIQFSYYAEGSFYLINLLGLTPVMYGMSFIGFALAGMVGSILSKYMHNSYSSEAILKCGLYVICSGGILFAVCTAGGIWLSFSALSHITIVLISMMNIMIGIGMMIPNALALALEDYKHSIGTAASLFGFLYYMLIALFTGIMSLLHDNTLLPMPLYFCSLSILMIVAFELLIHKRIKDIA